MSGVLRLDRAGGDAFAALRARLGGNGARHWFGGAVFALAYQAIEVVALWTGPAPLGAKVLASAALAVLYVLFLLVPPLVWIEPERIRVLVTLALGALSVLLLVPVGPTAVWTWPLVLAIAAFTWTSQVAAFAFAALGIGGSVLVNVLTGWPDSTAFAPFINGTVAIMMVAFGQQVRQTVQLRAANERIAQLAVSEERARFARDLHDSLGHSLTVVAVKAELAGKLIERDPGAARDEIRSLETLARDALADLRASVTGSREVTLVGELAAARAALEATGVAVTVSGDPPGVRRELGTVLAWAVREGTTNTLRHASASSCTIELRRSGLRMRNDGVRAGDGAGGSGLRGLADRAAVVGARVETRLLPDRGFELRVER